MLDSKLFVGTEDGRLFEHVWSGSAWVWFDHGRPPGTNIVSEPGAAMMNSKFFVTTQDGRLFERAWNGAAWVWVDHGKPPGTEAVTPPGAAMMNSKLFVGTRDGRMFERLWNGRAWVWADHGRPPGTDVETAPGAAMLNSRLFVGARDGRLFERLWNGSMWVWIDHGRPPGTNVATSSIASPVNLKLFMGTRDGRLFERLFSGASWAWADHGRPPGTEVATAPGAIMPGKLFVGTRNERLFERFWTGTTWMWVDHGTLIHDTRATLLDNSASGRPKKTIAVISEGFAEADLDNYRRFVRRELVDGMFALDLYAELRGAFNVIRIDLVSFDSGVSQRRYDEHGTPNDDSDDTVRSDFFRNTRLGYIFSGSWVHCWVEASTWTDARLNKALERFAPGADYIVVVLNEGGRGGCARGNRQVVTTGVNRSVLAHEFGHQFGLDDEYQERGRVFTGTSHGPPNCSVDVGAGLRWARLVRAGTPLPTDPVPAGWNDSSDVGAFLGCGTYESGLFRPARNCRMNNERSLFCPVCTGVVRDLLGPFV
jgi:hypothetical protein